MQQIRFIGGKDGAKLQPYSERKLKPLNSNKKVLVGDPAKKKIAGGRGNFLADLSNKLAMGPKKPQNSIEQYLIFHNEKELKLKKGQKNANKDVD